MKMIKIINFIYIYNRKYIVVISFHIYVPKISKTVTLTLAIVVVKMKFHFYLCKIGKLAMINLLHGSSNKPKQKHDNDGNNQRSNEGLSRISRTLVTDVSTYNCITLLNRGWVEYNKADVEEGPHKEERSENSPQHTLLLAFRRFTTIENNRITRHFITK